ncbi:Ferrous iron transport protein A [Staphylococcus aureus O46]|nr:Ferrous iron transport protein A [Staphylococcus aureus O46]
MLNIKNGEMNKAYKIKRMDIANENMLYRLSAFGLTDDAIITIKQKCLFKGHALLK